MIVSARAANFDASLTFPITTFFSGATAPISLNICKDRMHHMYNGMVNKLTSGNITLTNHSVDR